jgi:chemotaxis signal transduction protein
VSNHTGQTTICMIRLDDQSYGIDMLAIREANQFTQTVRIPGAPPQVLGMVNLRGSLFLLIDVRRLLGLAGRQPGPDDLLIVFRPSQGEAFGILVDALDDTKVLPDRHITPREPDDGIITAIALDEGCSFPLLSPELMYRKVKALIEGPSPGPASTIAPASEKIP